MSIDQPRRPQRNAEDFMRVLLTVYTTLTAFLMIMFFGVAPFLGVRISPPEAIGVVEVVLPVFTGYIGLIVGYYFGVRAKNA
jgi:hypothetical protein